MYCYLPTVVCCFGQSVSRLGHCCVNVVFSELVYEEKISVHLLAAADWQTCTRALQVQYSSSIHTHIKAPTNHRFVRMLHLCTKISTVELSSIPLCNKKYTTLELLHAVAQNMIHAYAGTNVLWFPHHYWMFPCFLPLQSYWQCFPVWWVFPCFSLSEGFPNEPCGQMLRMVTSPPGCWPWDELHLHSSHQYTQPVLHPTFIRANMMIA